MKTGAALRAFLLMLGGVVVALLGMEGGLRVALLTDVLPARVTAPLREPALYAEADTDDYWKLRSRWANLRSHGKFHHPVLGMTIPHTPANPLGVAGRPRPMPDPEATAPAILFYGDSYLIVPLMRPDEVIPHKLEEALGSTAVWNFGMWGYGIDQIVLRFELTHTRFRNPTVLIGITTDDFDRCIESVREGQKPRFVLDARGQLQLTNVPIEEDQAAWLARHPPAIDSYLARMAAIALLGTRLAPWVPLETEPQRVPEKRALATALIERVVGAARARGAPIAFVIFYCPWDLEPGGWRSVLLRETFERLGVPYLDTRVPLLRLVRSGRSVESLYDPHTRHHTAEANDILARAIRDRWPDLGRRADLRPPGAG